MNDMISIEDMKAKVEALQKDKQAIEIKLKDKIGIKL